MEWYIGRIISLVLVSTLFLSGCTPKDPYIKDISTSLATPENQVAPGDSFKLFVLINNPTRITFTPYVEVKFNTTAFDANNWDIKRGSRLELEAIDALSEKSYFLVFQAEDDHGAAKYPFTISLYGDGNSKKPLGNIQMDFISVARQIR